MMTLKQFSLGIESVPVATSWYLADLGEARGKQALFTKQMPQKLKFLREHALIESAISSNRIEGITIAPSRIGTVIFGKRALRDRAEEEIRGYRHALKNIHELAYGLRVSEMNIREFHREIMGGIGDAGCYKDKNSDIIQTYPDGRIRVRFKTVSAVQTPESMQQMLALWTACLHERWLHPLLAMAAMNLDFLCIHPFRDGNGRVSRLLLLLQCYHLGYEVGRYISIERLIEENKERYYETLEQSSQGWHEGRHNPWPYINYLLYILNAAYREFEQRVGKIKSPRGAKTELVETAIASFSGEFSLTDVERACPGVSRDMVRRVLRDLQKAGTVECLGRGPGASWRKRG